MAGDRGQRTEKPTGKKLQEARSKGNVPRSKEISSAFVLLGFLMFCQLSGVDWINRMKAVLTANLSNLSRPDLGVADLAVLAGGFGSSLAGLLVLPLGVVVVAGLGGNLIQGPPLFTLKPIKPDLSKIKLISGLKKLFKLRGWIELLKTVFKLVLYSTVAVFAIREGMADGWEASPGAEGTLLVLMGLAAKVTFRVAMLALALAILDVLFTRWNHTRELKMTKEEVKDERKQQEGDPLVKSRLRSKQFALARTRMMADVPKASVVVVNPTQFAVALRYAAEEMAAPQVLAKGRAKLAARILEIAREHSVPIVSDPPLARALYRSVPVGGYIAPQLFRAVAEVLALVLRRRHGNRRTRPVEDA